MYVEYFLIYVHGRLIILEKKKLPWTTLLVTGRLLVFHFLLSIKDLEPSFSQMDDSENINNVYCALDSYQFQ